MNRMLTHGICLKMAELSFIGPKEVALYMKQNQILATLIQNG